MNQSGLVKVCCGEKLPCSGRHHGVFAIVLHVYRHNKGLWQTACPIAQQVLRRAMSFTQHQQRMCAAPTPGELRAIKDLPGDETI